MAHGLFARRTVLWLMVSLLISADKLWLNVSSLVARRGSEGAHIVPLVLSCF